MDPSSSSAPKSTSLYDVFLSFRGNDTRNRFTGHLYAALDRQQFSTFLDDEKLTRGEYISSELLKAIEQSRVSIVIFSENYAGSRWCLDELVKIMECRKDLNRVVLPIFYNVVPSDVRGQRGCFSEAFRKHEERFKGTFLFDRVKIWRSALTEAANLSGWDLKEVANGNEAKFIDRVVEDIKNRLDRLYLNVADKPVGVNSRALELIKKLKLGSEDDVRIVAIWGLGGLGKTTIAKAVFNRIRNEFEGSSFLADVSETSKSSHGKVTLQKQLLSDILLSQTYNLSNHHQGIEEIKRKLCKRKVLVVLDDVDDAEQVKNLAINRKCFGLGSRIIVTTRNRSSVEFLGVDDFYSPLELDKGESLKLFCLNAFKKIHPGEGCEELSNEVVAYAGGLPLALELLGSSMFGKGKDEWKSILKRLKIIPSSDIQAKLKISFESLDDKDRELFLDIVFFFIGYDKDFTVKVLEDSQCFPVKGIGELARRCLVRVDEDNKLRMHDLLRDMGREIVRQQSLKEPGDRSRLWYHEDILQVLRDCTGRKAVEGLCLELAADNDEHVDALAFSNMSNLRLLHLDYLRRIRGTYITSSTKLKWIRWHGFPLSHIPAELYMGNLVAIDMRYSRLKEIWKGPKRLDKLRFLNLSYSCHLSKTPDFSGLKSLEELFLHDCTNLVEVRSSIGCLDKLIVLNMANCKNLLELPSSLFTLRALEHLDLSGCSKLGERLRFKWSLSMFRQLLTEVTRRPDYIALPMASVQGLSCLRELDLKDCNLLTVPSEIGSLMSLDILDLGGNNFSSLPSLSNLSNLTTRVSVNRCAQLKSLPDLPYELGMLDASNCLSLETGSVISQMGKGHEMKFENCPKVDWKKVSYYLKRNIILMKEAFHCGFFGHRVYFSGEEIPDDFQFKGSGNHVSFLISADKKIVGVGLCAIIVHYGSTERKLQRVFMILSNISMDTHISLYPALYEEEQNFTFLTCLPLPWVYDVYSAGRRSNGLGFDLKGGDEVQLEIPYIDEMDDYEVKECRVCLMYEEDVELEA